MEPDDQIGDSRLAGARATDDGDELAGGQYHRGVIQDVLAAVGEAHVPQRDRRHECGSLAAHVRLARLLGVLGGGLQEEERLLVRRGRLVVALQLGDLLQDAGEEQDEHEQIVSRLAPYRQEDVEPAGYGQDTDDLVRLDHRLLAHDDRPLRPVEPLGVGLDHGAQASLAGHRLQGLHAVQPLQQARHEGLLQPGLLPPRAAARGR